MIFKIIGGLFVVWGVLDFAMTNFMNTDIWWEWFGINLFEISELVYKYIAYAFIVLGGLIWSIAGSGDEEELPEEN